MNRRTCAVGFAAFALAGCGHSPQTAPPQPRLPRAVAATLAAPADDVARRLQLGDTCGAHASATALQRETIDAINAHEVPAALQEPLQSAATRVASEIACLPPAVTQAPPPRPAPHGHGKHEKKKHGHHEGGD
jgi:hypothetical protein